MKGRLPKWKERSLFEKFLSCLVIVFGVLAITVIILEPTGANNKFFSLFFSLELLSLGLVHYNYNKGGSIAIVVMALAYLVLTFVKMFW